MLKCKTVISAKITDSAVRTSELGVVSLNLQIVIYFNKRCQYLSTVKVGIMICSLERKYHVI